MWEKNTFSIKGKIHLYPTKDVGEINGNRGTFLISWILFNEGCKELLHCTFTYLCYYIYLPSNKNISQVSHSKDYV